jgi:single-strand DNA-binding protein
VDARIRGETLFDTNVTIVGNVVTAPEWRRTNQTKTLVANFKVASTARRFDKDANRWIDGNSLRVRVTCWRGLAAGVAKSLKVGDPVMVVGKMFTRDWLSEDQQHRVSYELEAYAVGHDLSRGSGTFERRKASATVAVEDAAAEDRINGELTHLVPELNATRPDAEGEPDEYIDDLESFPLEGPSGVEDGGVDAATERAALEILQGAGLDPQSFGGEEPGPSDEGEDTAEPAAGRGRRRGRQTVAA